MSVVDIRKNVFEISSEDVKDFFFVDYKDQKDGSWVKIPLFRLDEIAPFLSRLDHSSVTELRIQRLDELVVPVNKEGLTEEVCRVFDIEFIPYCQKVEVVFGSDYRITKNLLDRSGKKGDLEKYICLPESRTCDMTDDDSKDYQVIDWVSLHVGCHRDIIYRVKEVVDDVNEFYRENGGTGNYTDLYSVLSEVFERSLEDHDAYDWLDVSNNLHKDAKNTLLKPNLIS